MLAPAGLDAGLLVNAENVIAWPQCCTFPTALVKIEDATSLAGELRITREDPSAMTPGPQCVLAEPAPQGGAADLCHDAARHRLVAQFGDRPVRQGQTSTRRELTRQCLDRNDDTGGKTGRSPASRQVIKTGKSLETEAPTPLADDLARHVEAGSDALVAKPPVRQEYNLGPHNVAVWRRIVLGPDYQFGSLSLCELDQIGAFSGHDASSWPRTILPCPYESLKNTSPYLWNRVLRLPVPRAPGGKPRPQRQNRASLCLCREQLPGRSRLRGLRRPQSPGARLVPRRRQSQAKAGARHVAGSGLAHRAAAPCAAARRVAAGLRVAGTRRRSARLCLGRHQPLLRPRAFRRRTGHRLQAARRDPCLPQGPHDRRSPATDRRARCQEHVARSSFYPGSAEPRHGARRDVAERPSPQPRPLRRRSQAA